MKKLLLVAALAVFGFTNANAQDLNFGAKAGVNFANIGGDESDDYDGKTGFHLGLVAEIMLTDQFAFQPEILYSAQGARAEETYREDGFEEFYEADLKLSYINIPLLAKYYIAEGLSLQLGPQIGFLVSANSDYTGTYSYEGVTETESESEDMKEYMNSVDFALAGGVGYKLDMGLFFNARYGLGLSNIHKNEDDDDDFSQNNNVFQLSVGYMF